MNLIKDDRCMLAENLVRKAGKLGLDYFNRIDELQIDRKGHQDFVSEADRALEGVIRDGITAAFPKDAILGEEVGYSAGLSDYVWVIDPIDGTTNFVSGIPTWVVVVALVRNSRVIAGFIYDPIMDVMYSGYDGGGAFRNGIQMSVVANADIKAGSIGVGFSNSSKPGFIGALISSITSEGGMFFRNASGALSLAYVADGRLIGYSKDHMHPWDFLAGQLMVREAGGKIEIQDIEEMLRQGGRVVASSPAVFDKLLKLTVSASAS